MISRSEVEGRLREEAATVEKWLSGCLKRRGAPEGLLAAMEYSLMAGGKRIRPVLFLNVVRMLVSDNWAQRLLPFAGAIECIHTYSLIHDDLPAMDNADLRRGRASCHKRFDEATAILAGDGLLAEAVAFMGSVETLGVPSEWVLRAVICVAEAAGTVGMVGGQFLDMQYTDGRNVDIASLAAMHAMKTGALLRAPCVAGALLSGADETPLEAMAFYGSALGAAFQITDDILDVTGKESVMGKPVGNDAVLNKTTYVSLLGVEASRALAEQRVQEAINALAGFSGPESDMLRGLAAYCINRIS
ncbi:MAG: polyprenyl synthetase family protein [Desulfovibrio sp.]|nr:polyprenyl synthetase family protein [Desulfovibrio sp.]